MNGFIVTHPQYGQSSEVFGTYEEAEAEISVIIDSNIEEAVEQELELSDQETRTEAEIEKEIRADWLADYFVCEVDGEK